MSSDSRRAIDRIRRFVDVFWIVTLVLIVLAVVRFGGDTLTQWPTLAALLVVALVVFLARKGLWRWIPGRVILEVDFRHGVVEQLPQDRIAQLALGRVLSLRDVTDALERAESDRRVVGLVARLGSGGVGLAHAQEIRDRIASFRARGKNTIAWCDTFALQRRGTVNYYLAAAFDEIWLQPGGHVAFSGLFLAQPLVRKLLDRLGLLPQIDHRGRYKTAKYLMTESDFAEPHRESLQSLLDSQMEQIVGDVARDRGLEPERVRELIDQGLLLDEEAEQAGLVDGLEFRHEAFEAFQKRLRGNTVSLREYLARAGRPHRRGPRIAVVYAVGRIALGRSQHKRPGSGATVGADDLGGAIRKAAEDPKIKAIVLRIDSPGGSATASTAIWHAVRKAREAGKPVIASMSNVAGSGGYYIAAAADRVVAQPATITGSIGVVAGKVVTADAWQKLGVRWGHVQAGEQAAMWSSQEPFNDAGWQRFQRLLDHSYEQFKSHVAEGRGLTLEEVGNVAEGRLWSGSQAEQRRLVDQLGGLREAVMLARQHAGLADDVPVQLVQWPRQPWLVPFWSTGQSQTATMLGELDSLLEPLDELRSAVDPLRDGLLMMPGFSSRDT